MSSGLLQLEILAHADPAMVGRTLEIDDHGVEVVVGRSSTSDLVLDAPSISRRHAILRASDGAWLVSDLGSRHGTQLNGVRLEEGAEQRLQPGDRLTLGPIELRVRTGIEGLTIVPLASLEDSGGRSEVVPSSGRRGLAQQRLDVLLEAVGRIHGHEHAREVAEVLVESALRATPGGRAIVLRPVERGPVGDAVEEGSRAAAPDGDTGLEILASRGTPRPDASNPGISRSVVMMAMEGRVAQRISPPASLRSTDPGSRHPGADSTPSMVVHGIGSAIAAPISIAGAVRGVLYLDASGEQRPLEPDAAVLCEALAHLGGLALADQRRRRIERERSRLHRELEVARSAQEQLLPPPAGAVGPVRYAMVARPGREIAGDLLDVIPIDRHRTAVLIGDVSGKGAGPGLIMAALQSHLRASLQWTVDPSVALGLVNAFMHERFVDGSFITVWFGIADIRTGVVDYVDAGHGHWVHCSASGPASTPTIERSVPVGVVEDAEFTINRLRTAPGDRIVLYSDGLIEQADADGEPFGLERVESLLIGSSSVTEDLERLRDALDQHSRHGPLSDDLTIASFELRPTDDTDELPVPSAD